MIDCSKDVLAYHDDEVTLPQAERTAMRDRRDANRKRIRKGLEDKKDPKPIQFCKQGSYAMKNMVQHPELKYDIDDGIYFEKEDLKDSNGVDKSAIDARTMVRDAVDDGCFNTPPEVCSNCVRVHYAAGYHVDIPVYRRVVTTDWFGNEQEHFELASSDWKRSDARDVTDWFDKENQSQSPDILNGRQLRRMTRDIKKFTQSRTSWEEKASGLMITTLVTECYQANADREDMALYYTMQGIRDRLKLSLVVHHPVTPNDTITKGDDDPKAQFLRDKLSDAVSWLSILFDSSCTRKQAMAAWDKVYNTDYFSDRLEEEIKESKAAAIGAPAILTGGLVKSWATAEPRAVQKEGGGRYA